MKVKQLKKLLESFDDDLEVMDFSEEIGEYFSLNEDNIEIENVYFGEYTISGELAKESSDLNQLDNFDDKKIKEVLVIY